MGGARCINCTTHYYALDDHTCVFCNSSIPHCDLCDEQSIRISVCLDCEPTYFASNVSTCVTCGSVVAHCTDCAQLSGYSINCTACETGYFPSSTTACSLCSSAITNCATCSPNYAGGATCLTCDNTFFTASGSACTSCTTIDSNCYSCNNAGQCTQCKLGYYVNANYTCTIKPACSVSNCKACTETNGSICSICNDYFTLASDTLSCTPPTSCPKTNQIFDGTTCRCQDGYFDNGTACQVCSSNCLTCTSASACTSCSNTFFVSGGACAACSTNCQTCTSASVCTLCDSGFSID